MMFKRCFSCIAVLLAGSLAALTTVAQPADSAWPTKPITLIVPVGPGGNIDVTARLIGQKLSERLGQTIVVDNVAGVGGVLGVTRAVRAAPDGYTVLIGMDGPISVAQLINPAVQYDAERDLIPVGLVTIAPVTLLARPGFPAKTMDEMIDLARANPGTLTYATSGVGTVLHLALELVQQQAGIELMHVPYHRGGAQIINDVMGNIVDMGTLVSTTATPMILHGDLRALGVTSKERLQALPDVPAFSEAKALPGYDLNTWTGFFVPAGTPDAIVQKLNTELNTVLNLPDVRKTLLEVGATPGGQTTPASFKAFLDQEKATYTRIVERANIKLE